MPITHRKLAIFVLVAELGSISRAAARLRLAQPVVSRAVNSLEADFGVKLCDRVPKGVSLTDAGTMLVQEAREILGRFEQLEERVREAVESPVGRIHLGLSSSLAPIIAPRLLALIRQALPRMVPILHETNSTQAWTEMQSGDLDLSLISSLEPDADVEMDRFANEPICLMGTMTPELVGLQSVDIGFVASLRLILTSRPHVVRRMLDAQFSARGLVPSIVAETESLVSIRLALSGQGYTVYPRSCSFAFRGEPSLAVVPINGIGVTWAIAYSRSRGLTPPRRICARLIRETAAEAIEAGDWDAKLISR